MWIISNSPYYDQIVVVEKSGGSAPRLPPPRLPPLCNIRGGMSGQVLRLKGYYEVMIHKHHCEDVYDLIDLCYFL